MRAIAVRPGSSSGEAGEEQLACSATEVAQGHRQPAIIMPRCTSNRRRRHGSIWPAARWTSGRSICFTPTRRRSLAISLRAYCRLDRARPRRQIARYRTGGRVGRPRHWARPRAETARASAASLRRRRPRRDDAVGVARGRGHCGIVGADNVAVCGAAGAVARTLDREGDGAAHRTERRERRRSTCRRACRTIGRRITAVSRRWSARRRRPPGRARLR